MSLPAVGKVELATRAGNFPAIPGDNGSCQEIIQLCSNDIGNNVATIVGEGEEFQLSKACILAATCYPMYYNGTVDDWIQLQFGAQSDGTINGSLSRKAQRLSQDLYNTLVTAGTSVASQQSFIDAYYSLIATVGGPYPVNTYVINVWARIAAWTGFCASKDIPYSNLADWFQYSATSNYSPTC
ncbi:hypothetical protein PUNSTDRAFT_145401 [Punctularia strigosozonata HHB-11173 SS5]|uniref:uncharacterized protein n=1 Tax=Punctularia strigosozonata (strain HHB-11173) TaxID=741275 RepID=UPI0004418472|nr:uncharacterized protein PUNSTDRAFT_145401 [Punctularia strigosozonata HHB-11173 SS5]EIN06022.1 hypothetical protein PUNSTDRAFT_145401 [Punctularia strigosozonata HHB-11173 SS5]